MHVTLRVSALLAVTLSCSVDERRLSSFIRDDSGGAGQAPSPMDGGDDQGGEAMGGAPLGHAGMTSAQPRCGNGIIEGEEACDDGGDSERDGCNVACELEAGYECSGAPSSCRRCTGAEGSRRCTVSGGAFVRGPSETKTSASVSAFQLDELEVTVGRFRPYVAAYAGPPTLEAGAHPDVPASGWRAEWNALLPPTKETLVGSLHCHASWSSWTDEPSDREQFPLTCVSYYLAFAFCASQGGRLPTEAEWEYAAVGGAQQRIYPWGEAEPSPARALFGTNTLQTSGARRAGMGRFGQLDLSGSVWEWTLDYFAPLPITCDRCAEVENGFERVLRGGSFVGGAEFLLASFRFGNDPAPSLGNVGFRCAYSIEE